MRACILLGGLSLCQATMAFAFQLAPTGSAFEAKLTNESPSTLGLVAGRLGLLIKAPVHEEITHLGFGCPTPALTLEMDESCAGADHPFATAFVIYGVRWNDLPPFQLRPGEGQGCKKFIGGVAACKVSQTIRFSTQPECWHCIFSDAQMKAKTQKIAGCHKGSGYSAGNLLTRSHFGDLQFLHGMANEDRVPAEVTRQKILEWVEFAWKVSSREIAPTTLMRQITIPTIQEHFGCSEWSVADIYVLGRQPQLLPHIRAVAFGSVLHTVQDSFAEGHTTREPESSGVPAQCEGAGDMDQPRRIVEFHSYAGQDGKKHDAFDRRSALVASAHEASRYPAAVEATRHLADLYGAKWTEVDPYMRCLFALSATTKASSAGDAFR